MKVRFVMYPAEIGMELVYERLFAMDPHQRATPIKRLLGYLSCNPSLPAWFIKLPAAPITTHRQQTVRLNLTSRDPDLIAIATELEPLSEAERINHIKRMFAKACAPQTGAKTGEAALQRLEIGGSTPPSTQQPEASIAPALQATKSTIAQDKANKIRNSSAAMFRRNPQTPTTTPES